MDSIPYFGGTKSHFGWIHSPLGNTMLIFSLLALQQTRDRQSACQTVCFAHTRNLIKHDQISAFFCLFGSLSCLNVNVYEKTCNPGKLTSTWAQHPQNTPICTILRIRALLLKLLLKPCTAHALRSVFPHRAYKSSGDSLEEKYCWAMFVNQTPFCGLPSCGCNSLVVFLVGRPGTSQNVWACYRPKPAKSAGK